MTIVEEIIEKELNRSDLYTAFGSEYWKNHNKNDIYVNKKISINFDKVSNQEIEIKITSMHETYYVGNILIKNLDKKLITQSYIEIIKSNLMF